MSTPAPSNLEALFARVASGTASPAAFDASQQQQQQQQQPQTQHGHPRPPHFPQPQLRGYTHSPSGLFNYLQPSVSSPLYSPPASGTPPHHGSDIISPNVSTPRREQDLSQQQPQPLNPDRTSHLLSILKFSQPPSGPVSPRAVEDTGFTTTSTAPPSTTAKNGGGEPVGVDAGGSHARGISASDLIASFMPKPTAKASVTAPSAAQIGRSSPVERSIAPSTSGDAAQEMLLRLLNRPSKTQTLAAGILPHQRGAEPAAKLEVDTSAEKAEQPAETTPQTERGSSPLRTFGTTDTETTAFEPPKPTPGSQGPIFTYVNPFEQLAAASPGPQPRKNKTPQPDLRTATPAAVAAVKNDQAPTQSRKPEPEPGAIPAQITPETSSPNTGSPQPSEDKAKTAPKKESVPEAVEGLAEKVYLQAKVALEQADDESGVPKKDDVKTEPPSKEEAGKVEKGSDKAISQANEEMPSKAEAKSPTNGEFIDSWESEPDRVVPVYSFPLKPFVSITWKRTAAPESSIRDDGILNIAKLKKSFDQLDRALTSATSEYIVYALAKNGGVRVIRQDDGSDKRVFHPSDDRIFNVAVCRAISSSGSVKDQAVIATGTSGTVYWAPITRGNDDLFERDALDNESLKFPPHPAWDENTSGGQLKTRVRRSSRHPEFFAIGRGKSIQVVWPQLAVSPKYGITSLKREVDTEKFFKEKSVRIVTGKAGKDFVFSDDDSIIVSLDKTGRMKFWDIRSISEGPKAGAEIRSCLLTLAAGSPNEKSWPTSVLFVDKLRPYVKQCALRYVLVGLKQNHTLQLWDIGLGKAVQEVHFPHSNESDGICSVAYHPASGVIVVGHPTRNSIYFIHLSTPKYVLPLMSQHAYIQGIAEKSQSIPKPESTACMSGIRELSLNTGNLGQLRSLELLPMAKDAASQRGIDEGSAALFELYVMHSRGVTCLTIMKADLGWSIDNKIIQSVDSLEKDFIDVKPLQSLPSQVDEQSVSGSGTGEAATPTLNGKEKEVSSVAELIPIKQAKRKATDTSGGGKEEHNASPSEKNDKKKKKKAAVESVAKPKEDVEPAKEAKEEPVTQEVPVKKPVIITKAEAEPSHGAAPHPAEKAEQIEEVPRAPDSVAAAISAVDSSTAANVLKKEVKRIENAVSLEFTKTFNRELDIIYRRFDEDRRAHDEAATARQDAVLRLISSTLSDNVEKNLSRIIASNVQSTVVPALAKATTASMDKQVNEAISQRLDSAISRSIKSVLPEAVSRTLKSAEIHKSISELTAPAIVSNVGSELTDTMRTKVLPAFKDEYLRSTERVTKELEQRFAARFKKYEEQQAKDNVKIDQLTALVHSLSETVSTMATAQASFQNEILTLTRELHAKKDDAAATAVPTREEEAQGVVHASPEEIEFSEIGQLMEQSKYEDASIRWLQSSQQAELFDRLFVNYNPSYLSTVSPLVSLSVSAAVSSSLENNIEQRLIWLHQVLQTVDVRDPDIVQVAPQIMDIIVQRLGKLYMGIAENDPHHPILRKIPPLTRWATDLKNRASR